MLSPSRESLRAVLFEYLQLGSVTLNVDLVPQGQIEDIMATVHEDMSELAVPAQFYHLIGSDLPMTLIKALLVLRRVLVQVLSYHVLQVLGVPVHRIASSSSHSSC